MSDTAKTETLPIKFYHAPNSTANFTTALIAELEHYHSKKLAERITLSTAIGDTHTPSYLSTVNPNGKVPAIVHKGVTIWESAAIAMYLGETFGVADDKASGNAGLYPAAGPKRGEAMKWIVWTNVTFGPTARGLYLAVRAAAAEQPADQEASVREKEKQRMEEAKGKSRHELEGMLKILDGELKGREFLLGEEYSLADTHVWCFVTFISHIDAVIDGFGNVKGWMTRISVRPALKDVMSR